MDCINHIAEPQTVTNFCSHWCKCSAKPWSIYGPSIRGCGLAFSPAHQVYHVIGELTKTLSRPVEDGVFTLCWLFAAALLAVGRCSLRVQGPMQVFSGQLQIRLHGSSQNVFVSVSGLASLSFRCRAISCSWAVRDFHTVLNHALLIGV